MYILTCKNCHNNILKMQKKFFKSHPVTTFRLIVESNETKCCIKPKYEYCSIEKQIKAKKCYNVKNRLSEQDMKKLTMDAAEKRFYKIAINWIKQFINKLLKGKKK